MSVIVCGNVLDVLQGLPDEQFHCCVTSPPYWGLRDYGTPPVTWPDGWIGSFGLEPTYTLYVQHAVWIFREVRRVLRADGTLWLNLGDSYANDTKWGGASGGKNYTSAAGGYQGQRVRRGKDCDPKRGPAAPGQPLTVCHSAGLKPKDLVGIPWRVAFALQEDGWYLRSDIIWAKPNPMPESVKDRPTKAHEYLFLLAKSERYYYDADAIKEPFQTNPKENYPERARITGRGDQGAAAARGNDRSKSGGFPLKQDAVGKRGYVGFNARWDAREGEILNGAGRNKRSVWTIPTRCYPEAHFATFPEDLVRPCILAGCPPGGRVLDPFTGSGTALLVAQELGCDGVGIELNPEYCKLAENRTSQSVMALAVDGLEVAEAGR